LEIESTFDFERVLCQHTLGRFQSAFWLDVDPASRTLMKALPRPGGGGPDGSIESPQIISFCPSLHQIVWAQNASFFGHRLGG